MPKIFQLNDLHERIKEKRFKKIFIFTIENIHKRCFPWQKIWKKKQENIQYEVISHKPDNTINGYLFLTKKRDP